MSMNMRATTRGGKERILVVDDKVPDSTLLKVYLERTNRYVVREENDATRAMSAAEEFQPDLILLDVMMPGTDGGELAASFRAHSELSLVPIVFLTAAVTREEVEASGGQIGAFPFLAKPVVLPDLLAELERHLGGRRASMQGA